MAKVRGATWPVTLCKAYVDALSRSDYDAMHEIFTPRAVIESPIYGRRRYRAFYRELFDDTEKSRVSLESTFFANELPQVAAMLHYEWTLAGGELVAFTCVDIFDLAIKERRFDRLQIIYDTAKVRELTNNQ